MGRRRRAPGATRDGRPPLARPRHRRDGRDLPRRPGHRGPASGGRSRDRRQPGRHAGAGARRGLLGRGAAPALRAGDRRAARWWSGRLGLDTLAAACAARRWNCGRGAGRARGLPGQRPRGATAGAAAGTGRRRRPAPAGPAGARNARCAGSGGRRPPSLPGTPRGRASPDLLRGPGRQRCRTGLGPAPGRGTVHRGHLPGRCHRGLGGGDRPFARPAGPHGGRRRRGTPHGCRLARPRRPRPHGRTWGHRDRAGEVVARLVRARVPAGAVAGRAVDRRPPPRRTALPGGRDDRLGQERAAADAGRRARPGQPTGGPAARPRRLQGRCRLRQLLGPTAHGGPRDGPGRGRDPARARQPRGGAEAPRSGAVACGGAGHRRPREAARGRGAGGPGARRTAPPRDRRRRVRDTRRGIAGVRPRAGGGGAAGPEPRCPPRARDAAPRGVGEPGHQGEHRTALLPRRGPRRRVARRDRRSRRGPARQAPARPRLPAAGRGGPRPLPDRPCDRAPSHLGGGAAPHRAGPHRRRAVVRRHAPRGPCGRTHRPRPARDRLPGRRASTGGAPTGTTLAAAAPGPVPAVGPAGPSGPAGRAGPGGRPGGRTGPAGAAGAAGAAGRTEPAGRSGRAGRAGPAGPPGGAAARPRQRRPLRPAGRALRAAAARPVP